MEGEHARWQTEHNQWRCEIEVMRVTNAALNRENATYLQELLGAYGAAPEQSQDEQMG